MELEAVLLTGGASRRMGEDKASILVDGVAMGRRIASRLQEAGIPPTVLGSEPIEGFPFLRDQSPEEGPLAALRHYKPKAMVVFVTACDMPLFDQTIVNVLHAHLGEADAAIPSIEGRLQPLCALYRASALARLVQPPLEDARSMMAFLDQLTLAEVPETAFPPRCLRSANTPEEWEGLLGRPPRNSSI